MLFNAIDYRIASDGKLRGEWNTEDLILTVGP